MNGSRAIRVVVADDHATVLSAMVKVIEGEPGFEVLRAVDNGLDAVAAARETGADLVVIDVQMPSGGAVAAAAARPAATGTRRGGHLRPDRGRRPWRTSCGPVSPVS